MIMKPNIYLLIRKNYYTSIFFINFANLYNNLYLLPLLIQASKDFLAAILTCHINGMKYV